MTRTGKAVLLWVGALLLAGGAIFALAGMRRPVPQAAAAELIAGVPADAPTLVYIDLAVIRSSSFYQHRPDHSPIAIPDREYASFVQNTGFNFETDLDQVVIAAWPKTSAPDSHQTTLLAQGRFDQRKIRDFAAKNGRVERQQGHDVFLFPGSTSGSMNSLLFLDDNRIAMVEGSSVASLLGAPQDSANDLVHQRAARVAGAAAFIVSRIPETPADAMPGALQSPQVSELLKSVQWVTLAARPEGDVMRVSLDAECQSDSAARQLQSAVQILQMFGQAALENPQAKKSMDPAQLDLIRSTLKNIAVNQAAEHVQVRFELKPEILKLAGMPAGR